MVARRRIAAAIAALPLVLSGCGWTPLYADSETTAADAELRAIRVYPILDREGQRLERALRTSFNPDGLPSEKRYMLRVTVQMSRQDLGIQSQGLGTRGEVQSTASFNLQDIKTGKSLYSSDVHVIDSFDIEANGYSTVVAENDARARAVDQLRREIVTRLTLFLQRKTDAKT